MKRLVALATLVVISICATPGRAAAADFNISVVSFAYAINGQGSFPTITLTRGKTYTFANVDGSGFVHPFGIQDLPTTQGGTLYRTGVSGDAPLVDGIMTFNVPESAPSTLYYNCQNHDFMFGQINIVSAPHPTSEVPATTQIARGTLLVLLALSGFVGLRRRANAKATAAWF